MARKREEVAQLLATKFQRESRRLNSWGTKTDEKAAISFAMTVVDFVRALMCESRMREARRIRKKILDSGRDVHKVFRYVDERIKATRTMSKVISDFATKAEAKREWKPKHKHHHKKEKHGRTH